MTLLEGFDSTGVEYQLVDRRFSRSVSEVGGFSFRKVLAAFGLMSRLRRELARETFDSCVFFVTNRSLSFVIDVILARVLRSARVPFVAYVHTMGYRELAEKGRLRRWGVNQLLGSARLVVTLGSRLVADVQDFSRAEIQVVPNSPRKVPASKVSAPGNTISILYFSNLIPEKGVEDFLATAIPMSAHNPNIRFTIAGAEAFSGQKNALTGRIASEGLSAQITILGAVQPDEKWSLLERHQILAFPSTYKFEAQPLAILEAKASGLAVVAYDVGGVGDLIDHRKTGILVKASDRSALQQELDQLVRNPDVLEAMRSAAAKDFVENYSETSYVAKWRHILDDLVQHG